MFYVSMIKDGMYGITDTNTGITSYLSGADALRLNRLNIKVRGIENGVITPVNYLNDVVLSQKNKVKSVIKQLVDNISSDSLYDLALKNNVANKVKALDKEHNGNIEASNVDVRVMLADALYGEKFESVIESCMNYATSVQEININDKHAILDALQNKICFVVQFSAKDMSLTAFTATTNLNLVDKMYGKNTTLAFDLHNAYLGNIVRMKGLRLPKDGEERSFPKMEGYQKVYSCNLRVEDKGKTKINRVISSSEYTVVLDNVIAVIALNIDDFSKFNHIKDDIIAEMNSYVGVTPDFDELRDKYGPKVKNYELQYNKAILDLCFRDLETATNSLYSVDALRQFMNANGLFSCIDDTKIDYAVVQIEKAFARELKERNNGGKYIITV